MLIAIFQECKEGCYKWGLFDTRSAAVARCEWILNGVRPAAIPEFKVEVATPAGIQKFTLREFVEG